MSNEESIAKGKSLIAELSAICCELTDSDVPHLFGNGSIEQLLTAILDPQKVNEYPSIGEFFLANKQRASFLAALRLVITKSYSIRVTKEEDTGYVSPTNIQWFDDGVLLLEGQQPFEGFLALYRDHKLSYAITARAVEKGQEIASEDFAFIDIAEMQNRLAQLKTPTGHHLELTIDEILKLLDVCDPDESKYQELFVNYPWVLGLQYSDLRRHKNLDEKNIPDFIGVRVSDGYMDILEIKPPSMKVFREDGEFTADFNNAWNQAERYLNFAREDKDYLNRKGLQFDNPRCFLVCGYNLEKEMVQKVRLKEKMNPAIQLMTFNDIVAFMRNTVKFLQEHAEAIAKI